jgi:hypothetical protein
MLSDIESICIRSNEAWVRFGCGPLWLLLLGDAMGNIVLACQEAAYD